MKQENKDLKTDNLFLLDLLKKTNKYSSVINMAKKSDGNHYRLGIQDGKDDLT